MTQETLNETDEQLFEQMGKGIQDGSSLSALFDTDSSEKVETPEENPEEEQKEEESPETEEAPNPTDDWLEKVPDELKEHVQGLKSAHDKYAHQVESDRGRLQSYQALNVKYARQKREADELRRTLEKMQEKPRDSVVAALDIQSDEDFKELLESDPTFAKMFERQLKQVASKIEEDSTRKFSELTQLLESREREAEFKNEQQALYNAVPNAGEIFKSQAWKEYKSVLPNDLRALAESDRHEEVLYAIQGYAEWLKATNQIHPETEEKPIAGEGDSGKQADLVKRERQRKLEGAPGVDRSKPSSAGVIKNEQALLEEMYNSIRKEAGYTK